MELRSDALFLAVRRFHLAYLNAALALLLACGTASTALAQTPAPPAGPSAPTAPPAATTKDVPAAESAVPSRGFKSSKVVAAPAANPAVPPTPEEIAERLLAGTVTIRVALPAPPGLAGNNLRSGVGANGGNAYNGAAANPANGNPANANPSNGNAAGNGPPVAPPRLSSGRNDLPIYGPLPFIPAPGAPGADPNVNRGANHAASVEAPVATSGAAAATTSEKDSKQAQAPKSGESPSPTRTNEAAPPAPAANGGNRGYLPPGLIVAPPAGGTPVAPANPGDSSNSGNTANPADGAAPGNVAAPDNRNLSDNRLAPGNGASVSRSAEPRADNNTRTYGEPQSGNSFNVRNNELSVYNGLTLNNGNNDAGGVLVASGASLGNGLIVGWMNIPTESRVRVTLPRDGESLDARLRVVDHYTGLVLLRVGRGDLPHLDLAAETPAVGGTLYSAAAAGLDEPLVSHGILGGSARAVGTILPPLLPCDLRTTIASSGAPVVDRYAKLVGVVASNDNANERSGWTYVVPVRHVQRLLANEPPAEETAPAVLERRRPELGLTMFTTEAGAVQVERVRPGGPAATAGIREGDLVLETDGLKIRSVYQAVAVVLRKQPGDQVAFLIRRADKDLKVDITLAVGGRMAPPPAQTMQRMMGSYAQIRSVGPNAVEVQQAFNAQGNPPPANPAQQQAAVSAGRGQQGGAPQGAAAQADVDNRLPRDEMTLLREQLVRWSQALVQMRNELDRREESVRTLQARVRQLEEQLQQSQPAAESKAAPQPSR